MTVRMKKCAFALLFPFLASNALAGPFDFNAGLEVTEIDAVWRGVLLDQTTYWELYNGGSSGLADVMWASSAEYQGLFLWPDNDSYSQEFERLDSGDGYFRLKARHSGQCLMLDWRYGYYAGTPVIQYPYCDAGYAGSEWRQDWVYTSRGPNGYPQSISVLVNRATGMCLDADNPSGTYPPMQSALQQWDCITTAEDWNADNQDWSLLPADPRPSVLH